MDEDGHGGEPDECDADDRQVVEQGIPDDLPGGPLFSHDELFSRDTGGSREYPSFPGRLQYRNGERFVIRLCDRSKARKEESESTIADISKVRRMLGFQPEVGISDKIDEVIEWNKKGL
jgi:hypothetical protein